MIRKLTDEEVRTIREKYASNRAISQEQLADEFDVSEGYVSQIVRFEARTEAGGVASASGDKRKKLTRREVRQIRQKAEDGYSPDDLGAEFGVTGANVRAILRGDTWREVVS